MIIKKLLSRPIVHIFLISAIGFLAYSNTFHAPFQWDEDVFLRENPIIKNLGFFLEPSKARGLPFYSAFINRYVGYLTFAINYKVHGFSLPGYHIVNISIHLINAALVYFFMLVTFKTPFFRESDFCRNSKAIAFSASLLFVLHPIQTEAITYIFQRLASLAALFYLLSIVSYAYSRVSDNARVRYSMYALSILSAVLAMKTKENAFTLPIVITLYEFCFFNKTANNERSFSRFTIHYSRFLYLTPLLLTLFIIPGTVIGTGKPVHQIIEQVATADVGYAEMSRWSYLFTQFRVIITYIRLMFVPINQNLVYHYPLYNSFFFPQIVLSFLFLASLFGLGVYLVTKRQGPGTRDSGSGNEEGDRLEGKKFPPLDKGGLGGLRLTPHTSRLTVFIASQSLRLIGFGILWFFITLSVESSIIPLPMIIDEYRVYLPSAGFFMALCTALFMLYESTKTAREKRILMQLFCLIVAVLLGLTYVRNSVWSDKIAFWKDAVEKSPNSAGTYNNLGKAYLEIYQPDKAIDMFDRAISLSPDFELAWHNRGEAFLQKKEYDKALKEYARADAIQKDYMNYIGMGHAHLQKGDSALAVENFSKALFMNPHSEAALYGTALCFARTGKYNEAMRIYSSILHDNPYASDAYRNRGELYMSHKEYVKAIADLTAAVRVNPKDLIAIYKCALAYYYSGQYDAAISEYSRAIALYDKGALFYDGRGLSFYYKKDLAHATADFDKALLLDQNLSIVYTHRGDIYLKTGRKAEALRDFQKGCALKDANACASLNRMKASISAVTFKTSP